MKNFGLTESIWSNLSEDKKFKWKFISRLIALIGALFVSKTGSVYFDSFLTIATALFLFIVIESQRTYSRLPSKYRKASIRTAIFLGSWGITLLGLTYFLQAVLFAFSSILSEAIPYELLRINSPISLVAILTILLTASLIIFKEIIRIFRTLQLEEAFYYLPKKGLKQLLIKRTPKATSFAQFAFLELSALLFCLFYVSTFSELVKVFISIINIK
jgi:hypothetical protein